jgi:hypothetical protein
MRGLSARRFEVEDLASTAVSCQLELQSSSTILDQSVAQIGYDAQSAVLANASATALTSPDTVLLVCLGIFGGASYGQLIAIQVAALN